MSGPFCSCVVNIKVKYPKVKVETQFSTCIAPYFSTRPKGNFSPRQYITKKETEVSPRLTNFVLLMYNQLTSAQRYHLFVEHQNRGTRKEKNAEGNCGRDWQTSVNRQYKRNATARGGYNDAKAQAMAEERRCHGEPHNKTPRLLLWRIEQWIKDEQWSPAQIVGTLAKEGTRISKQAIYNHIHTDKSGELLANTRHKGRYNRKSKKERKPTKATNIPNRTSIHDRPEEANGSHFGDWEMDLIVGKDGYGAILVLTERNTSYCIIEKLPYGKNAKSIAKAVIRILYEYWLTGVLTITTDNGSEFSAHQLITNGLNGVIVYFADSYCSWQKGLVEYTNKLIRQYIPKETDFSNVTPAFIKKVQAKLNRRPLKKVKYSIG